MSAQPIETLRAGEYVIGQTLDNEVAVGFFERRWFGAITAVEAAERDLRVLCEAMELSQAAVRQAQSKLTELSALRDALGSELERGRRAMVSRTSGRLF